MVTASLSRTRQSATASRNEHRQHDLNGVAVSDQGSGVTVSGSPIASLAPGASDGTTYTGSYEITQADIDASFKDKHGRGDER